MLYTLVRLWANDGKDIYYYCDYDRVSSLQMKKYMYVKLVKIKNLVSYNACVSVYVCVYVFFSLLI